MKTNRLAEISPELQAAHGDEIIAEGSLREAVRLGQWEAVHRAVDELRAARDKREALEAKLEEILVAG